MTPSSATSFRHFEVDLVGVDRFSLTVRNRADGRSHTLGFDGVAIGANEGGDGYTLILPDFIAQIQGFGDAH